MVKKGKIMCFIQWNRRKKFQSGETLNAVQWSMLLRDILTLLKYRFIQSALCAVNVNVYKYIQVCMHINK